MTETLIPAAPEVVTPETVTPLRPSEALRLGRLLYPIRIEGAAHDGDFGACAWGAIRDGYGGGVAPWEEDSRRFHCAEHGYYNVAQGMVIHFNDEHHWSDNEIVAWLQGLGL